MPAAGQGEGGASGVGAVRRACDGGSRRLVVAEIQFVFGEADRPVEHHLQRGSARQDRVRTARRQHADHAGGGTGGGADARAHAIVPRRAARDGSDAGARGARLAYRARVAALIAFAADLAFGAVQFVLGIAVHAADAAVEIARHAVGQGQRIEADVEFAAALHPARLLELGHRAGDIAAHRDHDAAVHEHRKDGFQVDAVAFRRVFGADAVDQAQWYLRPGGDRELGRLGRSLLGAQQARDSESGCQ